MDETNRYIKNFLVFLARRGKSINTRTAYKSDLLQFFEVTNKKISEVTDETLDKYSRYLKLEELSNNSISRKLKTLSTFFKYLKKQGKIKTNPTIDIRYPKSISKSKRILADNEIRKLLVKARNDNRTYFMFLVALNTGVKISELASLRIVDCVLDFENPVLKVCTGEEIERGIPLNDKLLFALNNYIEKIHEFKKQKDFPLFYTSKRKHVAIRNIRGIFDQVFKECDIFDASINDIRNTFIVRQLEAGNDLKFVQEISGHKSIEATQKYLNYISDEYINRGIRMVVEL